MLLLAYMLHKGMLVNLQKSASEEQIAEIAVIADKEQVVTRTSVEFLRDFD